MTPADVAFQQVFAAWVSAGAAVVQAIGAVAAIIVSIQLARSSARREREADAAAERRMAAADEAERKREEAADRAAEARRDLEKAEKHNAVVDRVLSLGLLATDQCQTAIIAARSTFTDSLGQIHGGAFHCDRITELQTALPAMKAETGNIELLEAMSALQDRIKPESIKVTGGAAYVAAMEAKLATIFNALEEVEQTRIKTTTR